AAELPPALPQFHDHPCESPWHPFQYSQTENFRLQSPAGHCVPSHREPSEVPEIKVSVFLSACSFLLPSADCSVFIPQILPVRSPRPQKDLSFDQTAVFIRTADHFHFFFRQRIRHRTSEIF